MKIHSIEEREQRATRDSQLATCSLPLAHSQLAICILAIAGYFGPWIPHKTAALTVTGYELSEFAKFFPQVQSGAAPVTRAFFTIPLIAAAVSVGLLVNESADSFLIRLLAVGVSLLLLLALVPPLDYVLTPQYRPQLLLVAGSLLLAPLTLLAPRLSRRIRAILGAFLALIGAALPLWQFFLLRPLVVDLYKASIGLGWGLLLCLAGLTSLLLSNILLAVRAE